MQIRGRSPCSRHYSPLPWVARPAEAGRYTDQANKYGGDYYDGYGGHDSYKDDCDDYVREGPENRTRPSRSSRSMSYTSPMTGRCIGGLRATKHLYPQAIP